ncbi:hypothetical protein IZ6_25510 [Terrihabitans soli]|uniref:M28 family peptidase n=1 Tax=Terrihabitans soli TaxID=708113 RepID=A0A6S6QQI9_9HYPH|nr:hypothetical protein [Terrihabitans soli]BCJ91816.1 hypothetical protein IZ6_25510 [Terrihabitans soli]
MSGYAATVETETETKNKVGLNLLLEMLQTKRPAGSKAERRFIKRYLKPLGCSQDGFGNLILRIGDAPVLWSSHTDTVHREGGTQHVVLEGVIARLAANSKSNCLGADCTAGVWLMVEMIRAGVEGLYIFHREEECGGRGSRFIATRTPELLDGIKYAIAFDRYGYQSVITHQFDRCCSDEFGVSLSKALGAASNSIPEAYLRIRPTIPT